MKRAVLILTVFIPMTLAAQGRGSSAITNQTKAASTLITDASSIKVYSSPTEMDASTEIGSGSEAETQRRPSAQPSQPARPNGEPPPSIPGGMVGYVDSAIVMSQIRIRFDAGFHDSAPDRAEFFYPQCACTNLGAPGPDFPGASTNINFQQLYFLAEYAPVGRFSIFTEVPVRWMEPQPNSFIPGSFDPSEKPSTQTNLGISDVRAGIKLALAAAPGHSLTLQLKAYFPSGNGSKGLGTDHYSFEPSLLYYQRLSQRWTVESQIGDSHPISGSRGTAVGTQTLTNFAGDVFFYGIGPSYQLINGEHFKLTPVVEMFGWHVLGGLQTLSPFPSTNSVCAGTGALGCSYDAAGTNIINLKAGIRTSMGNHNSIYVGFGQAVTHSVWYEHIVRIEYRYSF